MSTPNQGKPWPYEDTVNLLRKFASGKSCSDLALEFGRTKTAIQARLCLLYFGECPDSQGPAQNQNQRWRSQEDALLFQMYMSGARLQDLASSFGRSPKSIQLRLLEHAPRALLRHPSDDDVKAMTKTHVEKSGLPENYKARWTDDEERGIDMLYRVQGRSIDEIAASAGRTSTAVSARLSRLYFGIAGNADPAPWCEEEDRTALKEYNRSKDLFATAEAISRKPHHVALRLLELLPRRKLVVLGASEFQKISATAKEVRSKRNHSEIGDSGDHFITTCCAICMDRKKDIALIPCGHTFCQQCVNRADMKICSICRQPVSSTLRLHN